MGNLDHKIGEEKKQYCGKCDKKTVWVFCPSSFFSARLTYYHWECRECGDTRAVK